jgi:hypothetical protein
MKFPLFFQLNNVWQYMTGNKETKNKIQKIWDRDNYLSAFRRTLYTEDTMAIKSYLEFLKPEKWDKGFYGTNFLYDVLYKQSPEIVNIILNQMTSEQKNEIYTSSFVSHFLEHVTFLPNRGGSTDETTAFRPMNPLITQMVLTSVMEHNFEMISLTSLNYRINKIQEVMLKKNYPMIPNFVSNDSINLQILHDIKAQIENKLVNKEEQHPNYIVSETFIHAFSLHEGLSSLEKKHIQDILNIVKKLPQEKLSTEGQYSLYTIMHQHLPELINNFSPIPSNIINYEQVKNSFQTSLNEILEQVNTLYSEAFQANVDNITIKEQFLNSKKMKSSL